MPFHLKVAGLCAFILCCFAAAIALIVAAQNRDSRQGSDVESAILAPASPGMPGDWPMYGHDPQHTSYNPDEAIISAANVGRLTQIWQSRINIGSRGYSSFSAPSVANGKVFIASSFDGGDNFLAFDAATGAPSWSAFIGFNPEECFGVGIGSTAAISGTLVSIGGGDGAYYGLSTVDGSQLWRDPLGLGPSSFAWVSPLLANGRAYVGAASDCDNPSVRGEVRSLDPETGAHTGSAFIVPEGEAGGGIWNSPAISVDGSKLFITTGEDFDEYNGPYNRAMLTIDPKTMEVVAANQQGALNDDQDWNSSPIVFHDASGRQLVGAGHKNGNFYAYDQNDVGAGPLWHWQPGVDTGTPPAYDPTFSDGGTLFFMSMMEHRLYAINPADGTERWPSVFIGETHGGIAVANGLVFINNVGRLRIVEEATGRVLRTIKPPLVGVSYSGPVVSQGIVYWTSGAYLNAWGISTTTPTPPAAPTAQSSVTASPTLEAPPCPNEYFTDVCPGDYFYEPVLKLKDAGMLSGYSGALPCTNALWIPCFKPYSNVTRGQVARIVSAAAYFHKPVSGQTFEDVPPGSTFYTYTERLAQRAIVSGYPCGGPAEPCLPPDDRPYFRPYNNITRGQLAKFTALTFGWNEPVNTQAFEDVPAENAFFPFVGRLSNRGIVNGYPCGGHEPEAGAEPCHQPTKLPYFRPSNNITRGQTAKIVDLARKVPTPVP